MSSFRRAWTNLNFYKEYLFGFETLVFATSGILSMHKQLVTLQRERKTSYDPFKCFHLFNVTNKHTTITIYGFIRFLKGVVDCDFSFLTLVSV